MALQLKFSDEHGVLQIDMGPSHRLDGARGEELEGPRFDSIDDRFGRYDLLADGGGDGGGAPSLFRSRYNSVEEELANTPYAFAQPPLAHIDVTVKPARDELFGPRVEPDEPPAFTVTQLIHAQDRYFDLSARHDRGRGLDDRSARGQEVRSAPGSAKTPGAKTGAFKVLSTEALKGPPQSASACVP